MASVRPRRRLTRNVTCMPDAVQPSTTWQRMQRSSAQCWRVSSRACPLPAWNLIVRTPCPTLWHSSIGPVRPTPPMSPTVELARLRCGLRRLSDGIAWACSLRSKHNFVSTIRLLQMLAARTAHAVPRASHPITRMLPACRLRRCRAKQSSRLPDRCSATSKS